jgi:AcrR family transcriptional regulator
VTTEPDDPLFVRERLIRGSIALIEQEGSSSLGVRRLAQAADRSSMCVYSKFGSRGGLLAAVYERIASQLLSAATSGEAYRDWARANPQLYALLFDHPLDALDVDPAARRDLLAALVETFTHDRWVQLHGEVSYQRITAPAVLESA